MSENLIKLRLYKYNANKENGLGQEIENVMIGGKITSCLDDTLDTAEITINNSTREKPYKPLTKFKLVLSQENNETKYYDYELRYDLVEKISMAKDLYMHRLYLGNPAISCQKRTCDNFAISYRLKDVTLESDSFDSTYIENSSIYSISETSSQYNTSYSLTGNFGENYTTDYGVINEYSSGKYITWFHYDVGTNSSGLVDITSNSTFRAKLQKTHYCIILDSATDGMSDEIMSKMNTWWKAQNTSVKIQVANMQSGKTYPECFEECPLIGFNSIYKKPVLVYTVPQLRAYTSETNGVELSSGASRMSYNNYVYLPTKTEVKIVDNESGISSNKTYYTSWGKYYAKHSDTSSRSRALGSYKTTQTSGLKLDDSNTDDLFLYEIGKTYTNGGINYTTVNAKAYIKTSANSGGNLTLDAIYVEAGKTYTFETTGYFGGANLPKYVRYYSNYSGNNFTESLESTEDYANKIALKIHKKYRMSGGYITELVNDQYLVSGNDFKYKVSFTLLKPNQMISDVILKQGSTRPNCYDLFKKAQICAETKNVSGDYAWGDIDNKMLPYVVNSETKDKLTNKELIEDTYQNKNLWEIFMQIGKYIHGKPYITFNQNKYELKFKDYGISEYSSKTATKNSIYSSNDIENYISSLDSYIENYFQYGNVVTECIRPCDNDGTAICCTDNAVLKTKYPILEIVSLQFKALSTSDDKTYDLTDYVYEHNIYKILPIQKEISGTTSSYSHYKGNSIYYHVNSTEIMGFQYKEIASDATTVNPYAIKQAMHSALVAGGTTEKSATELSINDYYFIIKYRTKDDARFKSYKPDIRKFIRNADVDLYPIQSQFNNQLDKTVDSEKYGNNTYGTLLRSGNETKEYQDYVLNINDLKDSGELYDLGNNYYVSKNTMIIYPTYVLCETDYSKDFNKLSEIIGIDSQPRFYEIAEDNYIKRNIAIDRFYILDYALDITEEDDIIGDVLSEQDKSILKACYQSVDERPNYAMVYYKSMSGHNNETINFNKNVVVPCIPYMSGNTITYEFDMMDNFGAGDWQKDATSDYTKAYNSASWFAQLLSIYTDISLKNRKENYTTRQSYQYCDVLGKADLMDFRVYHENATNSDAGIITKGFIRMNRPELDTEKPYYEYEMLPNSMGSETDNGKLTSKDYGYLIDKDARECLGVNFSCHIVSSSDRFIISNQFWNEKIKSDGTYLDKSTEYYAVYLSKEVDKFTRDEITQNDILYKNSVDLDTFIKYGYNFKTVEGVDNENDDHDMEFIYPDVYDNTRAVAIAFSIKVNNSQMSFLWAFNLGTDMDLRNIGRISFRRLKQKHFNTEYED